MMYHLISCKHWRVIQDTIKRSNEKGIQDPILYRMLIPYRHVSYHTTAHSSSNGQLEDGVEATNVDALINVCRAADCNCAVGMNGYNGERVGLDLELALDIPVSNIDTISRLIGMGKTGFIFTLIILKLAAAMALIDELPVCQVNGTDNHISAKSNLYRGDSESGVVSCAKAKSSGLKDGIDFVIRWRVGAAVKVLGAEAVSNGEMNAFTDCTGLGILDGGGLGVNAVTDDMARTEVATEPFPINNQADVLGILTGQ
eukprot:12023122-Ditylum_brightwellii.AAC.1